MTDLNMNIALTVKGDKNTLTAIDDLIQVIAGLTVVQNTTVTGKDMVTVEEAGEEVAEKQTTEADEAEAKKKAAAEKRKKTAAAKKAKEEAEAAEDDGDDGDGDDDEVSRESVMGVLRELKALEGIEVVRSLLKKVGAKNVKTIPDDKLAKTLALANKALETAQTPSDDDDEDEDDFDV